MLLVEGGCCLAESLGCGPQLLLVTPKLLRQDLASQRRHTTPDQTGYRSRTVLLLMEAIGVYQREISPRRPASCRFTPTCSHFAHEALERHGLRRGIWLSVRRLLRCRPGASGGADPVPG
jgi:putative membrane protein insertion efficiency factor